MCELRPEAALDLPAVEELVGDFRRPQGHLSFGVFMIEALVVIREVTVVCSRS